MQSNVLSIGRLVPRKGHIYLIDAVRKLVNEGMDLKLVIVGNGPEEQKIRHRAEGLDFRLELIASDDKLREEYQNADVFVLPSITDDQGEKEGLGLVLPEAMHFKLPVIAFDNGGIKEAVIDGYNGILLPEKDVDGLAKAIKKVLSNQDFRKKLVETAYEDVHKRFSIETIVNQHVDVYNQMLEHG
jgi:glycosyltransferase involved in cell wall biosynthesis